MLQRIRAALATKKLSLRLRNFLSSPPKTDSHHASIDRSHHIRNNHRSQEAPQKCLHKLTQQHSDTPSTSVQFLRCNKQGKRKKIYALDELECKGIEAFKTLSTIPVNEIDQNAQTVTW